MLNGLNVVEKPEEITEETIKQGFYLAIENVENFHIFYPLFIKTLKEKDNFVESTRSCFKEFYQSSPQALSDIFIAIKQISNCSLAINAVQLQPKPNEPNSYNIKIMVSGNTIKR